MHTLLKNTHVGAWKKKQNKTEIQWLLTNWFSELYIFPACFLAELMKDSVILNILPHELIFLWQIFTLCGHNITAQPQNQQPCGDPRMVWLKFNTISKT